MSRITVITMSPEELEALLEKRLSIALANVADKQPHSDELLKIQQVADLLKVSIVTIHQWKRKGLIPFKRISNKIYFDKKEVIEALRNIKSKSKYL